MAELEVFNGINFVTGDHLVPPVSTPDLARWILRDRRNLKEEKDLRWSHKRDFKNRGTDRRPAADVNPLDLASSGWGVILPQGTSMDVIKALRPLLDHRKEQASRKVETYYRELEYIPGESKDKFFKRHQVGAGPAHPKKLPYYLLIVGGPEVVPYRFQYLLDMQYAVGRLFFDSPADYWHYSESVILAEEGQSHVSPEACFFSVRTPKDRATRLTDDVLVKPLVESLKTTGPEWTLRQFRGEQASKPELSGLLGGGKTPALLLTAAHGMGFPSDHELQRRQQGAILCSEWRGHGSITSPEHYFSADDVGPEARLRGLIAFFFGCYSAGMPDEENFPPSGSWSQPGAPPPSKPFMSGLARRLLSHPKGSALAVVGHVGQAWGCSFGSDRNEGITHFESFFQQLLEGSPVGLAMDWLNERFAELSTRLSDTLDEYKKDATPVSKRSAKELYQLTELWRAHHDARNFVVLGDPAVRLANGPEIVRTPAVEQRRASPGGLHILARSHWNQHVDSWLETVGSRERVELGDLAEVVRGMPTGEKPSLAKEKSRDEPRNSGAKVVVDASAVLALLLQAPLAGEIAERCREVRGNIHAPHLLDVEVAQVLERHAEAHPDQAERCHQALEDLREMPVFRASHEFHFDRVWKLRQNFTVSEASYLALAEFLEAPLLTCDGRFGRAGHEAKIEFVSARPS